MSRGFASVLLSARYEFGIQGNVLWASRLAWRQFHDSLYELTLGRVRKPKKRRACTWLVGIGGDGGKKRKKRIRVRRSSWDQERGQPVTSRDFLQFSRLFCSSFLQSPWGTV